MLVYKPVKKNFRLILLTVLILLAAIVFERHRFSYSLVDIRAEIMALDPGFSSGRNLLGDNDRNVTGIMKKVLSICKGYLVGFPNRAPLQRLDIDIGFMEYQQLLQDRERALAKGILIEPTKVKAKIRFNNQTYKAKLRLKGDYKEHWMTKKRLSLKIHLKKNKTILGFNEFSIHKPIARQHPYDATFQSLVRRAGNLSSQHNYVRVFVNGESYGVMDVEEHMTKELLEKQRKKNSLIVKFSNEEIWEFRRENDFVPKGYRLSDNLLNVKLYEKNKLLESTKYRKQFTYIAQERIKRYQSHLYDIDKYSKALMFAASWNYFHTIVHSNWRHYWNPYTLQLEPLTTDQGEFVPIRIDNQGKWQPEWNSPFNMVLIQEILHTSTFKKNFQKNFEEVKDAISHIEEDFNFYHRFFPVDKKVDAKIVFDNIKKIDKYREYFFLQHKKDVLSLLEPTFEDKKNLSDEEAEALPAHIYARHYDNGTIEIYNLLTESIILKKILFGEKNLLEKEYVIPGYTGYKPFTLQINKTGLQDNNLIIETELKGHTKTHPN
ncbi:MAG: hypothetical protein D3905_12325, partial [Candidatus Electrothrix sp. AS4_5]|nr:hypothetical protein [Candidatus Electrothrix gigas]